MSMPARKSANIAAPLQELPEVALAGRRLAVILTEDRLADGERLALAAGNVAGQEPVEADVRVVGALLLGQEQGEAVPLGEREDGVARAIRLGM